MKWLAMPAFIPMPQTGSHRAQPITAVYTCITSWDKSLVLDIPDNNTQSVSLHWAAKDVRETHAQDQARSCSLHQLSGLVGQLSHLQIIRSHLNYNTVSFAHLQVLYSEPWITCILNATWAYGGSLLSPLWSNALGQAFPPHLHRTRGTASPAVWRWLNAYGVPSRK